MHTSREDFDREQLAKCVRFTVCAFQGSAKYTTEEYASLAEALAARQAAPPLPYGRKRLVYGITPAGLSICVDGVKGI